MSEIDWREFYEKEAEVKRYTPDDYYHKSILSLLSHIDFDSVLDIGCGDGHLCHLFRERGIRNVAGVDISKTRVAICASQYQECEFKQGSAYDIPYKDNSFDLVTAIEVIEHLEEPLKALKDIKRVSKKYIMFQVPYNEVIKEEACPHCLKPFYPRGHIQSFDERKIEGLCEKCGLNIIEMDRFFHAFGHPVIKWVPLFMLKRIKKLVFREFIKHGGYIGVLCER